MNIAVDEIFDMHGTATDEMEIMKTQTDVELESE